MFAVGTLGYGDPAQQHNTMYVRVVIEGTYLYGNYMIVGAINPPF